MTGKTQLTIGFVRWLFHDVFYLERAGIDPTPVWDAMGEKQWFEARMIADDLIHELHEAVEA